MEELGQNAIRLEENEEYESAIEENKKWIRLGRKEGKIVAEGYRRIGDLLMKRKKPTRAMNGYLLSLKEKEDSRIRNKIGEIPDIEDLLNAHTILKKQDTFNFNCTMCGECCKTSDYILLTPYDLYLMTRSPAMKHMGISNTTQLRQSSAFQPALKFTLRTGLPICYLRPIQTGQCHFAYPLYQDSITGELLRYEQVQNPTIEHATPILNSYERPALACMFGPEHMPTMCATYPMGKEISFIDFWDVEPTPYEEEEDHQRYVILETKACEGFFPKGEKVTLGVATEKPQTVETFLNGSSNINCRWKHQNQFMSLLKQIDQTKIIQQDNFEAIQKVFVRQLAHIWYNFDALSTPRPFKTFDRVFRVIETTTHAVLDATIRFLQQEHSNQVIETEYMALLSRLSI